MSLIQLPERWGTKAPSESRPFGFDLSETLPEGEKAATVAWSVTQESGPTDSNPSNVLVGDGVIQPDGLTIGHRLQGGVSGACYRVRATVTSDIANVYVVEAILPVLG